MHIIEAEKVAALGSTPPLPPQLLAQLFPQRRLETGENGLVSHSRLLIAQFLQRIAFAIHPDTARGQQ